MSDAPHERFHVTADDLRRYDWQARIAAADRPEIHSYHTPLVAGANACKDAGDDLGRRVFSLLHAVASFYPNYDARGNPYGPMWTNANGTRSMNAEDLTDADLAALSGTVADIKDPEYRARVADVLWITDKNFKAAKIAIIAFLESAERLKTDDLWPPYAERLERAAQISVKKGFESEYTLVLQALEAAIAEFENNIKSGLLCDRLMSILLWLEEGDTTRYAALSERLARHFGAVGNWHFSEHYWQNAEQWHRRAKNEPEAQRCQIEAAECNVSSAQSALNGTGGALGASAALSKGLEALRRSKAPKARLDEVHHLLLDAGKRSLGEMRPLGVDYDDIPGLRENENAMQEASAAHVRGYDFKTAIERFANVTQPTSLKSLKAQHAKASEDTIFAKIIGISAIDHTGKVSDTLPPLGFGTPEEQEESLRKHLTQMCRDINWPLKTTAEIEPARFVIINEHPIRRYHLHFLVLNNPFIPQGSEGIYLRGLQAGFIGDWLMAMHLLIPQVESSIREVLQQHDVITSTLKEGIQMEQDLNQLLYRPEVAKIFGEDILFDLRGLLIERFGHNFRNQTAHGLLPEGGFYQPAAAYLWWFILHLCWRGYRMAQHQACPTSEQ
jgi:hypothetical protein